MYIVVCRWVGAMMCKRSTEYLLSTCDGWVVRNTRYGVRKKKKAKSHKAAIPVALRGFLGWKV